MLSAYKASLVFLQPFNSSQAGLPPVFLPASVTFAILG